MSKVELSSGLLELRRCPLPYTRPAEVLALIKTYPSLTLPELYTYNASCSRLGTRLGRLRSMVEGRLSEGRGGPSGQRGRGAERGWRAARELASEIEEFRRFNQCTAFGASCLANFSKKQRGIGAFLYTMLHGEGCQLNGRAIGTQ